MTKNVLCISVMICAVVFGFLHSCSDKDYYDPTDDPDYVTPNASSLDFSTSRSVTLNMNYNVPEGFISCIDFYTDYPLTSTGGLRTDLTPIAGAIDVAGKLVLTRNIPSYIEKLYAYSPNLFVPLVSSATIVNGVASFQTEIISVDNDSETRTTRAGNAGDMWSRASVYTLKEKDDFYSATSGGNFKYDIIVPDFEMTIPGEVLTYIGQTFPEWKRRPATSEFVRDATFTVVKGEKDNETAKVYISPLYSGCSMQNSLYYFVYTGDKEFEELTKEEVNQLEVITLLQLANANTNTFKNMQIGLTPGKYIQLLYKNEAGDFVEDFPVGAKIGWRLNTSSFNTETFAVSNGNGSRFSVPAWNDSKWGNSDYTGGTDSNHTVQFEVSDDDGNVYKCFGFEDQRYNTDEDYNDLIFHVYTDPADAIGELPEVNLEDILKHETYKGILAFEDNWPAKGDYDLNDVVVKYESEVTYITKSGVTNSVTVKKVIDTFSFIHTGAAYQNAFSYKVNLPLTSIKSIMVFDENENKQYAATVTVDGDGFIVDLCPNVKDVIDSFTNGVVENPQVYTVTMEFNDDAVSQSEFSKNCAPYNPFISPKEKAGVEVHLPMYPPTTRADVSFFGTEDDRSDMVSTWYVSGDNIKYPFALHLADTQTFNIPEESKEISTTYPKYLDWVNSGMTDSKDWYQN